MNQDNIRMYLSSLNQVKSMHQEGIIDDEEYLKAENFLAKKYCIKIGNIYRKNRLLLEGAK